MIITDNQYILQLIIGEGSDSFDFPLDPALLESIHIIQNNLFKVPTLTCTFYDAMGLHEISSIFRDSNLISVGIGSTGDSWAYRLHAFRLFNGPPQKAQAKGTKIKLTGFSDITLLVVPEKDLSILFLK